MKQIISNDGNKPRERKALSECKARESEKDLVPYQIGVNKLSIMLPRGSTKEYVAKRAKKYLKESL